MNALFLARPRIMCYARIDLKDCHLFIRDGLSGTAAVKAAVNTTNYAANTTTLDVDTVDSNTDANVGGTADQIPVGARLLFTGDDTVQTVTNASDSMGTWTLTISPGLTNTVDDDAVVTILPQYVEIKVGEGNVTYTEKKNRDYQLDRGLLDTVRDGDEAPVEAKLEFVYEFVKASSGESITPVEAIKGIDGADTFITSSDDHCEPFCVDIVIEHRVPCGDTDDEISVLKEFRYEQLDYDIKAASISVSGKCKITDVEHHRGSYLDWESGDDLDS